MGRAHRTMLLLGLAFVLLAPFAHAQQIGPDARLSVTPESLSVGPGGSENLVAEVQNAGNRDASTRLTFSAPPAGWTIGFAEPAQRQAFTVAAGATVRVTLRALVDAAGNAQTGDVGFTATMNNDLGQPTSSANDKVVLNYVAPAPPPEIIPAPDRTPVIVGSVVGGLAVVLVALYLYDSSTVRIRIQPLEGGPITLGSSGVFVSEVTNTGLRPRNIQLRVRGLPRGWVAAFAFPSVLLEPKETSQVPLSVKVPTTAGSVEKVSIEVAARPGPYSAWLRKAQVPASVVDPEARLRMPPPASGQPKPAEASPGHRPPPKTFTRPAGLEHSVDDLEGMGPEQRDALHRAGVARTDQLRQADVSDLSHFTEIPRTKLEDWQAMADLLRILGVGPHVAALLVFSGIRSPEELAKQTPALLRKRVESYLRGAEGEPIGADAYLAHGALWIEGARGVLGFGPGGRRLPRASEGPPIGGAA